MSVGVPSSRITDRDLELLAFLAEHRIVVADHIRALLGVSATVAYGRLRALAAMDLVTQRRLFHGRPACYLITRKGLAARGSELPAPRIDLRGYAHDVGLAWIWLVARNGRFGLIREVVSERQMRSSDARGPEGYQRFGVRLGGYGPGGKPRLHYPDLVLVTAAGKRVAVELELTGKGRTRRDRILGAYGADRRIDAVLYLAENPAVARSIQSTAARLDLARMVHVQPVRWGNGRAPDAVTRVSARSGPARCGARPAASEASR
jgi:hypothetical protein